MIRNYLKVGLRTLRKNWSNSLINISGLSLSVGCAITTFLFADFFFNLNSIHADLGNIYQVVSHIDENQHEVLYGPSPTILAERVREDLPEVKESVRIHYKNANVKFGANVFRERVQFADPAFFEVFDFPLLTGQKQKFIDNDVFISSEMATKYFGRSDPIGKRLDFKFGEEKKSFIVGGVFGKVPANTTFRPHILLNFNTYLKLENARVNWIDEAKATFVLLDQDSDLSYLSSMLDTYLEYQNKANTKQEVNKFELISFHELSNRGDIREKVVYGNDKTGTIGIAVTGILLIFFACLNYVNIAISSATTRLKEIGVRKVLGSSRIGIAQQFLTENFLTCALAMVLGVAACYFLLLPGFNQLSPIAIPFSFSSLPTAIMYFVGLFLLLALLSGSYPAVYISRFQSLKIFKGEKHLKGKNYFSRILLTIQFALVFITILGCFVFTDNADYVKGISWGYDPKGILSIPIGDESQLEQMKSVASMHADIQLVSASYGHLGVQNPLVSFEHLGDPFKVLNYGVSEGYLNLMGLSLVSGRYFEKEEDQQNVVVNRLFVEQMDWRTPIGQSFEFQGKRRTVIGVVENVYHEFFDQDIQRPMLFTFAGSKPNFLVIKSTQEKLVQVNDFLAEQWEEVAPFDPYVSYFQADTFNGHYANVDANIWFMVSLSVLTIFLSCLGLYGLLAFTLQNRLKEFSIRKVLGASEKDIIMLANREFMWIMVIAFGVGAPLGIIVMQDFVKSFFATSKPLGAIPVVMGLGVTIGSILISVIGQIRKATRVNPVDVLKKE